MGGGSDCWQLIWSTQQDQTQPQREPSLGNIRESSCSLASVLFLQATSGGDWISATSGQH